jgi:hypothetical protein
MLFTLDTQRQARLAAALAAVANRHFDKAAGYANQADEIRHGIGVAQLQAVLALLQRDFDSAWIAYRRARSMSAG